MVNDKVPILFFCMWIYSYSKIVLCHFLICKEMEIKYTSIIMFPFIKFWYSIHKFTILPFLNVYFSDMYN